MGSKYCIYTIAFTHLKKEIEWLIAQNDIDCIADFMPFSQNAIHTHLDDVKIDWHIAQNDI